MVMPGLINLDFADVRSVMCEMGKAMMGTGEGEGDNRAIEAAEQAIANPLLDGVSMQGAKGVIISIIGGDDMRLLEVDEAANHIRELVDPDANIIWGSAFNPDLDGKIRVSVVATGIEQSARNGRIRPPTSRSTSASRAAQEARAAAADRGRAGRGCRPASHDEPGYGGAGYGEEPEQAPEPQEFEPPVPAAYEPAEEEAEAHEDTGADEDAEEDEAEGAEGLSEPADDSAYGAGSEDGYASLSGTRIERDPDAVPGARRRRLGRRGTPGRRRRGARADHEDADETEPAGGEPGRAAARRQPARGGRTNRSSRAWWAAGARSWDRGLATKPEGGGGAAPAPRGAAPVPPPGARCSSGWPICPRQRPARRRRGRRGGKRERQLVAHSALPRPPEQPVGRGSAGCG